MISEDRLSKINHLPREEVVQILNACIHRLCIVDVSTAMQMLNICRTRVYQLMTISNTLKIGKHKFIMIN